MKTKSGPYYYISRLFTKAMALSALIILTMVIGAAFNANAAQMGGAIQGTTINVEPASVSTYAGAALLTGSTDGTGTAARFFSPYGITTDGTNLYVADNGNHTIRKIVISTGVVTTLAGTAGIQGSTDGTGQAARFNFPWGITTDGTNLYVADTYNHTIRKVVISTAAVTTLAGSALTSGSTDGTGAAARFKSPYGITTDGTNLYVADTYNHAIRKIVILTGVVTTLAGSAGLTGTTDGTGTAARFSYPYGITTDGTNLYVADFYNYTIRKIVISSAAVTTLAGTGLTSGSTDGTGAAARFNAPAAITTDGTNLYVADSRNHTIRKIVISTAAVTTLAGAAGVSGSTDGTGSVARFYYPYAITTDGTNLYVAGTHHNIRKITQGVTTYAVTPSAGAGGTISPATPQTIVSGATTAFTVTPNTGYSASVGGTCGGALVGTTYTTNAITTNCTVTASFNINTFTVTPSASPGGTISPATPQTVNSGATTAFTVTPNAGYSASVGGTCGGALVGTTYTTNAITTNCTVTASFNINTFTVTPSADAGGAISPATPQAADYGTTPSFTVTPDAGYSASVGGTCGGALVGTTYTTNAITANCTVTASFVINTYTVTPSAGAGGAISPAMPQAADYGTTPSFTVTPDTGYSASVGGTCGGALVGATYTTNAITANCTVTASFSVNPYTVTPSAGANGAISPATPQAADYGTTPSFTLTPNTGYAISSVTGCAGTLVGNTYTTGAITADCAVTVVFAVPQPGEIITVAGNGTIGFSGDGGQATSAGLYEPFGMVVDSIGNVYIADSNHNRIRKVATDGIITTVAGNDNYGFSGDGGQATSASVNYPRGLTVDSAGNIYIADTTNNRIRKVGTDGVITTVAGNGTMGFSGDGGQATAANLYYPIGVAVDSVGNVYIADTNNNRIRKVATDGVITTIAGNGTEVFYGDGGQATLASVRMPYSVTVDSVGNVYIADTNNNRIRKVGTDGVITTVAGNGTGAYAGDNGQATSASLNIPTGVAVDSIGNIYIADFSNYRIRKVGTNGVITTVAGNGTYGFSGDGGPATSANLSIPRSVAVDSLGNVYIADTNNIRIRKVQGALASGTYTWDSGIGALAFNITNSGFTCEGFFVGTENQAGVTVMAGSMIWPNMNNSVTWTRSPAGAVNDIVGVWQTSNGANSWTLTVNGDGTFLLAGVIVTCGNGGASSYVVTPSAGANGSISPSTPQTVISGATTAFTVTPNTGYAILSVTGCNGTLNGNTYTTGTITAACAVTAEFVAAYTVTTLSGTNGSITPSASQVLNSGAITSFVISPNTGYAVASVTGCAGTLNGNIYTTGAIMADCTVTAEFVAIIIPASNATLTSSLASPQIAGTNVTFTGGAAGGTGPFEYAFRLYNGSNATWTDVQAYSTSNTWTWVSAGVTPGSYAVQVRVRNVGSTASYETYLTNGYYLIAQPASGATLTSSLASPQTAGMSVIFTAGASGGTGPFEYAFRLYNGSNATWTVVQAYSTSNTWTWVSAGVTPGSYVVQVRVRNVGSTSSYETYQTVGYNLIAQPASGATLTPNLASPQTAGTSVIFTAGASGGTGPFEYAFRLYNGSNATWTVVQAYSTSNTWTWASAGVTPGSYAVQVRVRNVGSTSSYETYQTVGYYLIAQPASGATLTSSLASPQTAGTNVTFTGGASGGTGPFEYAFRLYNGSNATWTVVQAFSASNTWTWASTGVTPGSYAVQVRVRNVGSTASYETYKTVGYYWMP